jgi:transposase InsO family protein
MVPVREATTKVTIKALKTSIFYSFSVPEVILSDKAQCFVSREFKQFCFEMGVKHVTTSSYYPQPSHAERFNRNLRATLIAYHSNSQETWDQNAKLFVVMSVAWTLEIVSSFVTEPPWIWYLAGAANDLQGALIFCTFFLKHKVISKLAHRLGFPNLGPITRPTTTDHPTNC